MGTAPGAGQLGRARAWEGARKRPCRQVGVSPTVISAWPPASPSSFLLPPGLQLSVFDVRELRRAWPALDTVTHPKKAFVLGPQAEAGVGRSFNPFFRGWCIGTYRRETEKEKGDRQSGMVNNNSLGARTAPNTLYIFCHVIPTVQGKHYPHFTDGKLSP